MRSRNYSGFSMSVEQVPIGPNLFTWPTHKPSLIGSRCQCCGEYFFPVQRGCANCSSTSMGEVELGDRGVLWTWTIQGFIPKTPYNSEETPETFTPFGVGYVEMPCGVKVEARLKGSQPDQFHIGMPMQLVIEKLRTDDNGNDVMVFAFQAAEQEA